MKYSIIVIDNFKREAKPLLKNIRRLEMNWKYCKRNYLKTQEWG